MGKSGKRQRHRLRDARIARIIARLLEVPGPEVFQFFDDDGEVHDVRSSHVNDYVRRHMGEDFTAKDFRTWGGTVMVTSRLLEVNPADLETAKDRSAAFREAIAFAAERLGNTPEVTRASYVDPRVLEIAEDPEALEQLRSHRTRKRRYLDGDEQRTLRALALTSEPQGKRTP